MMAQQYTQDVYQDFNLNRSPGPSRYMSMSNNLNRQPSRQFENHGPPLHHNAFQGYEENTGGGQYDSAPRFNRQTSSAAQHSNNYPYDNQTWNYGGGNGNGAMNGINGLNSMGGTGRIKPSSRRAGLPQVRSLLLK